MLFETLLRNISFLLWWDIVELRTCVKFHIHFSTVLLNMFLGKVDFLCLMNLECKLVHFLLLLCCIIFSDKLSISHFQHFPFFFFKKNYSSFCSNFLFSILILLSKFLNCFEFSSLTYFFLAKFYLFF